jgi:isopenicillin-N N-acyltransferase-like protein
LDARIGIIWPALVRKVLLQNSAADGRDVVMGAPLGSGHHYTIADEKDFFGVETSGTKKKLTQVGAHQVHFHTNHCLDEEMAQTHTIRPGSTTFERFQELEQIVETGVPQSGQELFESFGRVAIAADPANPKQTATCGAFVMEIAQKRIFACKGPPSKNLFQNPPVVLELHS